MSLDIVQISPMCLRNHFLWFDNPVSLELIAWSLVHKGVIFNVQPELYISKSTMNSPLRVPTQISIYLYPQT